MIVKALSAAALVAAPVPVQPVYIDYPLVEKVTCDLGTGTAFVAGGKIISVDHVTSNSGCEINGVPLIATKEQGKDFSTAPAHVYGYAIDCEGFKENEIYWAVGAARGGPERVLMVVGTGAVSNGWAVLYGSPVYIPGMSGGPVFGNDGRVVGVVNAYSLQHPLSFSVQMKDTELCRSDRA